MGVREKFDDTFETPLSIGMSNGPELELELEGLNFEVRRTDPHISVSGNTLLFLLLDSHSSP